VSKATTLAELCAERGIDAADVIAFGDMPNDLAMLARGHRLRRRGRSP
jgi:hydroxymethylpyrimidine pyrophosphatase-like HAD family hydrolase